MLRSPELPLIPDGLLSNTTAMLSAETELKLLALEAVRLRITVEVQKAQLHLANEHRAAFTEALASAERECGSRLVINPATMRFVCAPATKKESEE
jgi:hypothetical protein